MKKILLGFILGIIVTSGTVFAISSVIENSSEITFDNTGTTLSSTNVEDAIKELTTRADSAVTVTNRTLTMDVSAWCTGDVNSGFSTMPNLGWKTIKVTSITDYVTSSGVFKVNGRQLNAGQSLDISNASTLTFAFSSIKKSGTEDLVVCSNKATFQLLVN